MFKDIPKTYFFELNALLYEHILGTLYWWHKYCQKSIDKRTGMSNVTSTLAGIAFSQVHVHQLRPKAPHWQLDLLIHVIHLNYISFLMK